MGNGLTGVLYYLLLPNEATKKTFAMVFVQLLLQVLVTPFCGSCFCPEPPHSPQPPQPPHPDRQPQSQHHKKRAITLDESEEPEVRSEDSGKVVEVKKGRWHVYVLIVVAVVACAYFGFS